MQTEHISRVLGSFFAYFSRVFAAGIFFAGFLRAGNFFAGFLRAEKATRSAGRAAGLIPEICGPRAGPRLQDSARVQLW